jgi:MauM/NapG family ferredoxin protein
MNNNQDGFELGASRKPKISRRDLFHGRFWKLLSPATYQPLVKRYPKNAGDLEPQELAASETHSQPTVRTVAGISIEPITTKPFNITSPRSLPIFRPPGAIEERQFLSGCTRCNDCSTACPHQAIRPAAARLGTAAGTPTIEADIAACQMCDDFPCIRACKPGVLTERIPAIMGTAIITAHLCLAHHGTTCTTCYERCPVAGAIAIDRGKPTINEELCTGCGVCRYVCPAPENAILLMPAMYRPSLPMERP